MTLCIRSTHHQLNFWNMWVSLVAILIKKKVDDLGNLEDVLAIETLIFGRNLHILVWLVWKLNQKLIDTKLTQVTKSHASNFNFRGTALGNSLTECLLNLYRRGLLLIYIIQVNTDYVLQTFNKSKWRYEKSSNITKCTNPFARNLIHRTF